jgi:SAM-dependent methyltransferase
MFGEQFYPTPESLVKKMLVSRDKLYKDDYGTPYHRFDHRDTVLEPSAGKGDIAKALLESRHGCQSGVSIDVIEIDPDLRRILEAEKGLRVVHDDFLTYETMKRYTFVAMNPPFADGDKHLMKALDLLAPGGRVVCILNAETIRNPHTRPRKELVKRLDKLNAEVEYIKDAFSDADRKTDVEIALIRATAPAEEPGLSVIMDELHRAHPPPEASTDTNRDQEIIVRDYIRAAIHRCDVEQMAGLRVMREYLALAPYLQDRLEHGDDEDKYAKPLIQLKVGDHELDDGHPYRAMNIYLADVRRKYWSGLFHAPEFVAQLTSKLQEELHRKVEELGDYEFSEFNIYSIRLKMAQGVIAGIHDAIMKLFDELAGKYHWHPDPRHTENIHYYNGWATNKAYYIGKRCIIPLRAWNEIWGRFDLPWSAGQTICDMERVFNFLDGRLTNTLDAAYVIEQARKEGQSRGIRFKFFTVSFYKRGSCHLEFTNKDLLDKFNLYGGKGKRWLPPGYGQTAVEDMGDEERAVMESFEGEASYRNKLARPEYFLAGPDAGQGLLLTCGNDATADETAA